MEYTRLDALIDVMFTTAKDVESSVDSEKPSVDEDNDDNEDRPSWEFTDPALMAEKRDRIISAFAQQHKVKFYSEKSHFVLECRS